MQLLDPLQLGPLVAPNRVMFGPHVTNLGRGRALSERHVAYYRRRAEGGAGIIVCEEASVHASDWPYERAPLASECRRGWEAVAGACHPAGSLVLAALGHTGGQGSSAWSQSPLWAPSRVPEVNSREVPKWMEPEDIEAVVAGFEHAAALAAEAGLDGVEVNAGQHSLVRQFLSGLTNHRDDEWGTDRSKLLRDTISAARAGLGEGRLLGLRFCGDELAPWAGITPEAAAGIVAAVAPLVDYVAVVRGSIFTVWATRPDMHEQPGFNLELCRAMRTSVREAAEGGGFTPPAVVWQGSVVDPARAASAVSEGVADLVEMTRALLADAELVAKVRAGMPERVRPCILCNQLCQARDVRNPIVSCTVDPATGHETVDPPLAGSAPAPRSVVVVGGGPAGLEAARVAAARGHSVKLYEQIDALGGALLDAAQASGRERLAAIAEWLEGECRRLGVEITTGAKVDAAMVEAWRASRHAVILATGSRKGERAYEVEPTVAGKVRSARKVLSKGFGDGTSPVVVLDPIGGPIGVSVAETCAALGRPVHLVTPDHIAGNELARTGDLVPANTRLQQAGVLIERRSLPLAVRRAAPSSGTSAGEGEAEDSPRGGAGGSVEVVLEDRFSGARRVLRCGLVVDAGYRLPDAELYEATGAALSRIGDAVAPRTIHEAILEARRAVLALEAEAATS